MTFIQQPKMVNYCISGPKLTNPQLYSSRHWDTGSFTGATLKELAWHDLKNIERTVLNATDTNRSHAYVITQSFVWWTSPHPPLEMTELYYYLIQSPVECFKPMFLEHSTTFPVFYRGTNLLEKGGRYRIRSEVKLMVFFLPSLWSLLWYTWP